MLDFSNASDLDANLSQFIPEYEGYRLARMDISNFGGYHGPIQTVLFGLDGTLLTGANGAGKSTLIDAFSLLFSANPPLNVAVSSGRSRTLESYVLGQYAKDDNNKSSEQLRERGDRQYFTLISAQFRRGDGEVLTLIRMVLTGKKPGDRENMYVVAQEAIDVPRHFNVWRSKGLMAEYAEAHNWRSFSQFKDYQPWVAENLGFDGVRSCKAAFNLLARSAKMETAKCVTTFVRNHILPEGDLQELMQNAFDSVHNAREQVDWLDRAADKIEALNSICDAFDKLDAAREKRAGALEISKKIPQLDAELYQARTHAEIARERAALDEYRASQAASLEELAKLEADLKFVQDAIGEQDGNRFDKLTKRKAEVQGILAQADKTLKELTAAFAHLEVEFDTGSKIDWEESFSGMERRHNDLEAEVSEIDAAREEARSAVQDARKHLQEEQARLASLKKNRTALDDRSLAARAQLAEALGVQLNDLLFFGECVRIREGQEAWEGVANRVLKGAAYNILVPSHLYRDALRELNRTHWGIRVQLLEVSAHQMPRHLERNALAHKLEVRDDYSYRGAVQAILSERAFHQCVSADDFSRGNAGACVTQEGSVSRKSGQAEKDDSTRVNDRSRYVLGWSVEAQIALAEEAVKEAEAVFTQAQNTANTLKTKFDAATAKAHFAKTIAENGADYEDVMQVGRRRELAEITRELANFDQSEVAALKARETDLKLAIKVKEAAKSELGGLMKARLERITELEEKVLRLGNRVDREEQDNGELSESLLQAYDEIARAKGFISETSLLEAARTDLAFNIPDVLSLIRSKAEDDHRKSVEEAGRAQNRINNDTQKFLTRFQEEAEHLGTEELTTEDEVAAVRRAEWRARRDYAAEHDLPSNMEKAQVFLQETVQNIPLMVSNFIQEHQKKVFEHREAINAMLHGKTFDPANNSRAELQIRQIADDDFKAFERLLTEIGMESEEADIETLKKLADKLTGMIVKREKESDSQGDLRKKLSNLNNRFAATLHEFTVDADGNPVKTLRNISTSADCLSGGQQERLTNLLIAAALSSAFGAHDEVRRQNALQMVILDEAFNKSSQDTVEASADIYAAMGIQLIVAGSPERMILSSDYVSQSIFVNINSKHQSYAMSRPITDYDEEDDV